MILQPDLVIDGVTLVEGDRAFLFGQEDTENGVITVGSSDPPLIKPNLLIAVKEGAQFSNSIFITQSNSKIMRVNIPVPVVRGCARPPGVRGLVPP